MIEGLKPYAEYKESGLPWLQAIPSHWQTSRNGNLFQQRNDTRHPYLPLLEVSMRTGVRVRDFGASKRKQVMSDAAKYKRAAAGDVAYNMMRMWQGAVGVAPVDGLVSPAYVVARPFKGTQARYYTALFRNGLYMGEIDAASRGIVKDRNRLYWGQFKQMRSLLPPPDEQAAIVRFLDHANRKIDGFIRAKRKLIGLLNEQKQAIIHRAVTRGLHPDVPLKPSGIPWLGDIPKHWEVRKLRHLTRQIIDGTHFTPTYQDAGVAFLRVTDIHGKQIDESRLRRIPPQEHIELNKRCNPEKGDLLLSKNGTIGVTKVVDWDFPCSIFVSLCLIKPIERLVSAHFIAFAFAGGLLEHQLSEITKTTSVTNLHLDKIRTLLIPLPPRDEQDQILKSTNVEVEPVEVAIARTEREIALMQEYRTRLTADLVTGKLDVREAAAKLPEVEAEPAVEEALEELLEETELEESGE